MHVSYCWCHANNRNRVDSWSNFDGADRKGMGGSGTEEDGGMERNSSRYHYTAHYEAGNPRGYCGTGGDNPQIQWTGMEAGGAFMA